MNIIGLVGSSNDASYNKKLLKFIQSEFKDIMTLEIITPFDFPLFTTSQSLTDHPEIQAIAEQIQNSDGVIIATGEHSRTIPPALKNALEWLTTETYAFDCKPVMVIGASYLDQGTSRSQLHLRQILESPEINAYPLPGNEFLLGNVREAFDASGHLKNETDIELLADIISKFKVYIKAIRTMES